MKIRKVIDKDPRWVKTVEWDDDYPDDKDVRYTTPDGYEVTNLIKGWLVFTPSGHPHWRSSEVSNLTRAYEVIEYLRSPAGQRRVGS